MLIRTLLAFLVLAGPAAALERAVLTAPDAPEELIRALNEASRVLAAHRDGNSNPQDILAAARADYGRMVAVLYAHGRYSGVVQILADGREAASISPLDMPDQVRQVEISVDPGPVFRFGAARIAPLPAGAEPPGEFASGRIAGSGVMEETARAGIAAWRDAGHARARIGGRTITANHARQRLDANLSIEPGPRLRFGQLMLDTDNAVSRARIREIAGLPVGGVYSPAALDEAAGRLQRTSAFRSVTLDEAGQAQRDGTLDIHARLTDAPLRRFGFGGEYSTTEGVSVSGYWLHRNLLGGAERLRLDGEVSGIAGETGGIDLISGVRYTRPATPKPDIDFFVEFSLERLDEQDFLATQYGSAIGLEQVLSDTLTASIAIEWQHARVEEAATTDRLDLVSLPVTATLDRRDRRLAASNGEFLQVELRPFSGFGDTSSGLRVFSDARLYRQPYSSLVLAGRLQLGSVSGPSVATAPPAYLFYSGGSGTVRGQPYQFLGIDLGGGRRRGGRSFLGASAEARAALTGPFGLVAFADAGYVGAGPLPDGTGDWHGGAGIGGRYETGIGPIRFDAGFPVGGAGKGPKFYIGVGQAF